MTMFRKEEKHLITYAAGDVKSTVDYVLMRQENKNMVCNAKVVRNEECVHKHHLLIVDCKMTEGR